MSCNTEVSVESYLHEQIGRRLAEDRLSSSGDITTDREDSPLQSKRSSMSSKKKTYFFTSYYVLFIKYLSYALVFILINVTFTNAYHRIIVSMFPHHSNNI